MVEGTIITSEALVEQVLRLGYTNSWNEAVDYGLEEMIRSEAVYAKAREEGFDKSPQVLDAIRLNLPAGTLVDSNQALRAAFAREIIISRFLESHLALDANRLRVSDTEIQDYYRQNQNEFSTPPLAQGMVILVRVPTASAPENVEALRKRAESIRVGALQQKEPGEFASRAREHSDDPATRNTGGNMGWVGRDATNQWPGPVLQALFALRHPGDISPVVTASQGFYVLRLIKHRPESVAEWAVVREQIRARLAEKKEEQRANKFFASLKSKLHIRINRNLVEAVKQQLRTNAPGAQSVRDHL